MLHILWLALKIIGILLAAALALLLLAAALVLFCPLAYRVKIQKDAQWQVWGKASWLFGFVSVTVEKEASGIQKAIRIGGVRVSSWKKLFKKRKRPGKKAAPAEDITKTEGFPKSAKATGASGGESDDSAPEGTSGKEKERLAPKAALREEKTDAASERRVWEETKEEPSRENFIRRLWTRIVEKCRRIRDAFRRLADAIRNVHKKISLWKAFMRDARTNAALQLTGRQALRLLRHAGPQKCKGYVNLGFDNPAVTGQALAALGAAYPLHRGRIAVNPVWDRAVLEGEVFVKGRVFGIILLHMAGILYFDKDVKYAVNWFRGQES